MLKYHITPNKLNPQASECLAKPVRLGRLDEEALKKRILNRGTLITETDLNAVFTICKSEIANALAEGYTLKLPIINTSFAIRGKFDGQMDTYDKERHRAKIIISKGRLLRDVEKNLKPEKTDVLQPNPLIKEVRDGVGKNLDTMISAGVLEARGRNLKIAGDDPACGLWLVAENGQETMLALAENKPRRLIAKSPPLTPGSYKVKLVTQYASSKTLLKKPRTSIYEKDLIIY